MLIPSQIWGEDIEIDESDIKANLQELKENIAHLKVKIIAVTKYFGRKSIIAGYEAGIRDFAESRAKEAIEKIDSLPEDVKENSTFHFIGHLQSNKVEKVVRYFDVIHSVDSLKLAEEISKKACSINKREKILLQVNNAEEEQKSGFSKELLKEVFDKIYKFPNVEVVGLMNMAPLNANDDELEKLFSDLRLFKEELESFYDVSLPELSMGMSNDYKIAIKNGATMIRIGRKLFSKV